MMLKSEFIEKLHAQIDKWDAELDRLATKAVQVEAEAREEYHKQIAELKSKKVQIEKMLEKTQKSGDEAWQDLKSGIDLALESMNEALQSALSRFK